MSDTQKPKIDSNTCTGCTICIDECPTDALELNEDVAVLEKEEDCTGCGACEEVCPLSSIIME